MGTDIYNLTSAGNEDIYLVKTDSLGNSACNESNPATLIYSSFISVTQQPDSVSAHVPTDIPVITTIGGGGIETTLCIATGTDEVRANTPNNDVSIFPNPFSNSTTISFSLSQVQNVSLKIYDVTGRLVKTLIDGIFEEGENKIEWKATDENAGIYFLKMETESHSETMKVSLMK
ncbi:MAG TPA: T9SS type A sorting domain-containing protein [Chitinophagales bacterium]|nr:T9SS type A sorting domain-containing protein [Chitinophagales bacterium]